jgi:hypothetical protein
VSTPFLNLLIAPKTVSIAVNLAGFIIKGGDETEFVHGEPPEILIAINR